MYKAKKMAKQILYGCRFFNIIHKRGNTFPIHSRHIKSVFLCKKLIGKMKLIMISEDLLSWRKSLSYINQSIDLQNKSMDWFLYGRDPVIGKFLTYPMYSMVLRNP